ncbi:hypothetical protein TraAM80_06451 [Trypanosoma rangeli]|uniref:Uncharacterized protein n=1 Tax=Trypanosoma rangeli TaxID=5698 RepID=A0A3R7RGM0_TRYRA|nr:uncharacterized protein TraAM80_06451 [Trypanosoma rangeli]RNF02316.1 hypothetical protein TraAM80_06451 [Trypanosoma rangeli]|eukprot:RNF02316.1 hypothetical protein TraAM80_06451 [Trypanosoma rangeli]
MGNCCASSPMRPKPQEELLKYGPSREVAVGVGESEGTAVNVRQNGNTPLSITKDAPLKAVEDAQELTGMVKEMDSIRGESPNDRAYSGAQGVLLSPLTASQLEIVEPAFRCSMSDDDCVDTVFDDSEFLTAQSLPLSLRQTLGPGISVVPSVEANSVDLASDLLAMSGLFMSCRSFCRATSPLTNDTQLTQRLPREDQMQLPVLCGAPPLTDGMSDTAFMSCRSFYSPTPHPRDKKTLSSFGISSHMRRGMVNLRSAFQCTRSGNTFERFSSVGISLSASGAPEMQSLSHNQSCISESAMFCSCISILDTPLTEDGCSVRGATPQLLKAHGEATVQEPPDFQPPSSSLEAETVPAAVRQPRVQQLRGPVQPGMTASAPTSAHCDPRKHWSNTTHTTSYAAFRWRKNPAIQQSSGPLLVTRSHSCELHRSCPKIAFSSARKRKERLGGRRGSQPPKRVRDGLSVPFGQQYSWPKMNDIQNKSVNFSLSPHTQEQKATSTNLNGLQRVGVWGRHEEEEIEGTKKRETAQEGDQGEKNDNLVERRLEDQLTEDVAEAARGRGEKAEGSFSTEGKLDCAVLKEAGESDNISQATKTCEALHADESSPSCVTHVTDDPAFLGTPLVSSVQSVLHLTGELGQNMCLEEQPAPTELSRTTQMASSSHSNGHHVLEAHTLSFLPILSAATSRCSTSNARADACMNGNENLVNTVGDAAI